MNVSLTPVLEKYVHAQVKSGRYGSASEVVRSAIRTLQTHEKDRRSRLKELRATIEKSIAQADAGNVFSADEAFAEVRRRLRSRARRRSAA